MSYLDLIPHENIMKRIKDLETRNERDYWRKKLRGRVTFSDINRVTHRIRYKLDQEIFYPCRIYRDPYAQLKVISRKGKYRIAPDLHWSVLCNDFGGCINKNQRVGTIQ